MIKRKFLLRSDSFINKIAKIIQFSFIYNMYYYNIFHYFKKYPDKCYNTTMQEADLYEKLNNNQVKCQLCNHFCKISENKVGICGVRQNLGGKLYCLNYGKLITEAVDPIEKKPLFHFLPGSHTYSIATVGCNLHCGNCQNWQISQFTKIQNQKNQLPSKSKEPKLKIKNSKPVPSEAEGLEINLPGYEVTAEEIVAKAKTNDCQSIAYTFTEPTIFTEFALDCMILAHKHQLKNVWVSNGYMSKPCLDLIIPYLDAINVDLKFFSEKYYSKNCGCHLTPILDNLKYLTKNKIHLEITTLLIPGITDLDGQPKKIAEFIKNELSKDTPWHISRFSPEISNRMKNGKTTPEKLIDAVYQSGKETGLNYIYVGNVYGDKRENTYCPKCQKLNIERNGYQIKKFDRQGKCLTCNNDLKIIP